VLNLLFIIIIIIIILTPNHLPGNITTNCGTREV
jgi:Sec-independent protein translocase protein TatA